VAGVFDDGEDVHPRPGEGHRHDQVEQAAPLERARQIGLFRYMLIREAADPTLSGRQRGRLVRTLTGMTHIDPEGRSVRVSRWTLDRWISEWRRAGFDALVPSPRQSQPRTPAEVLELAAALKKENPSRSAAQIRRIALRTGSRVSISGLPDLQTGEAAGGFSYRQPPISAKHRAIPHSRLRGCDSTSLPRRPAGTTDPVCETRGNIEPSGELGASLGISPVHRAAPRLLPVDAFCPGQPNRPPR
jgi:transposase